MPKVMIVDDDPDVRALLSTWLRGTEFHVILGADGYQAVQLARAHQPDVIMLDINMPAAGGFMVHDRLKRLSTVANIPIIFISVDVTAEAKATAEDGARFLAKPLDKDTVLRTLREVCASS